MTSDSCVWRLIPLPEVRSTYMLTSAMQGQPLPPEALEAIAAVRKAATEGIEEVLKAQAAVVPTEIVVNVQTVEASLQSLREESSRRAKLGGPVANQLRTKAGECWRNLRDKLPGN